MSNTPISTLNDLIETSKDGEYGFKACAERATAPLLKDLLNRRSAECAAAAAELQTLVVRHGGEPETSGTVMGAVHRGWVKLVDAVTGDSDQAILNECERGEDSALASYRKALKQDGLPADVVEAINRQLAGVQRNHDQIKAMRDQHAAMS